MSAASAHHALRVWPALLALLLAIAWPPGPGHLALALLAALAARAAGATWRAWWRWAAAPLALLPLALLPLLVRVSPTPPHLAWADPAPALAAGTRALCAASILVALAASVPLPALIGELGRLGCPAVVRDLMFLVWRQLQALAGTAASARLAARARAGRCSLRARWRSAASQAGLLCMQALERGRRAELGLRARGWQGALRWPERQPLPSGALAWRMGLTGIAVSALLAGGGPWR